MKRTIPAITAVAAVSLVLGGCAAPSTPENDGIAIVASTSVYGDIATSIVGDLGTVTSIISDSGVDPHSFEASARDQLAIADADLVITNGGGYDPFMGPLVEASGSTAVVIDAVDLSGLDGGDQVEGFNEHVWYSLEGMTQVIGHIAEELGKIDPANAVTFDENSATLIVEVEKLETRAAEFAGQFAGAGAAVTEPVPVYLLEAVGLENLTPSDFTEAIEEGNDVPPLALEDTLDLFASGSVRVLAYNSQTASPETERVRQTAEAAGVPVVQFTETLPEGSDYVSWMSDNLDALSAALQP
ncbi:metal ABC transporter solute-binding protein, Zn/Mn family [Salinibacterium sp.]|uniref:metal ABC transporter solute-binding protein, Zn/Mn family n=1 Tax=Salinibacterium sp. TaxID=1915057 RepID=UPI00286A52A2|nr:zinc ABC transporter substrate-binding protein [Salinibacterium sp.]